VVLEFVDLGDATEIILTHSYLPTEKDRKEHNDGWMGCLAHLETILAEASGHHRRDPNKPTTYAP